MSHTFLLEVGIEDMPAHVILNAENQFIEKTKAFLKDEKLTFGEVTGFSTPRRFTVMVKDLAEKQPDENLTVRGPAQRIAQDEEGNWTKAAMGFSKGQGGSVEDLIIKDENGEPYVYMEKFISGKNTVDVLKGMSKVVESIEFPKNMKWGTSSYQYVRPIHWLVALLDEQIVPLEVFEVESGNETEGHRFLGEPVLMNHPDEYEDALNQEYVIANRSKRQAMIVEQIENLCAEKGWVVPTNQTDLLEEVTDLVEYPTVFYGEFKEEYLSVPESVLVTSMKDHQRYFPVREAAGENKLLPYFISVRNGNDEHLENVARGNEKVLTARLADAKFFFEEDQKVSIDAFNNKLKNVDYHDKLGTIYEKEERAVKMVGVIQTYFKLTDEETDQLARVASIYKFDLVTQVVDEFPNLQGTIGALYAAERNEDDAVAKAIGEQYLPVSVTDDLPETQLGQYISLIDKLDSLIQFFSVGLIPTGSNDPYALRRQAMSVVRLLLAQDNQDLELEQFIEDLVAVVDIPSERLDDLETNKKALVHFLRDRLEQIMQSEYGLSHDVRQAALGSTQHNLIWILNAAQVLEKEKEATDFKETVESITRVVNMTAKQGEMGAVNAELFESDSEKQLATEVEKLEALQATDQSAAEQFDALQAISPAITAFFEHNMIMVDDVAVKENRLTLLSNIANIAKEFADFSQLII